MHVTGTTNHTSSAVLLEVKPLRVSGSPEEEEEGYAAIFSACTHVKITCLGIASANPSWIKDSQVGNIGIGSRGVGSMGMGKQGIGQGVEGKAHPYQAGVSFPQLLMRKKLPLDRRQGHILYLIAGRRKRDQNSLCPGLRPAAQRSYCVPFSKLRQWMQYWMCFVLSVHPDPLTHLHACVQGAGMGIKRHVVGMQQIIESADLGRLQQLCTSGVYRTAHLATCHWTSLHRSHGKAPEGDGPAQHDKAPANTMSE